MISYTIIYLLSWTAWQAMNATGASVYFNCEEMSYLSRDNQATIEKLKDTVVDTADESNYMYSTSTRAARRIYLFIFD